MPSLDGLRAICIVFVMLGHVQGTASFPLARVPFAWAHLGVTTFFGISGFLITTLHLKQQKKTGTMSLPAR